MTLCVVNDDCVEFEVIPSGVDAGKYHWRARIATPQSTLGTDVPSATNLNALRCVTDPSDPSKKVLLVPEHTARTDLDIASGTYTPNFQRSVPFTIAPADLDAYNLVCVATTIVNPSSARTFVGLFAMRSGANINIGINTSGQVLMEAGFGTPPADFLLTTAVTLGPNIVDQWSYWASGGLVATQADTASITDNPTFELPPSASFTYWSRTATRELNLGAKNGLTINTIRSERKFLAVTK
jgi:hypothetical protein